MAKTPEVIQVSTQGEFNKIDPNFKGIIEIIAGCIINNRCVAATIRVKNKAVFNAGDYSGLKIEAMDQATVKAGGGTVYAYGKSLIGAAGNAVVYAYDESKVTANDDAVVYANGCSSVECYRRAYVFVESSSTHIKLRGRSCATIERVHFSTDNPIVAEEFSSVYWNLPRIKLSRMQVKASGHARVVARIVTKQCTPGLYGFELAGYATCAFEYYKDLEDFLISQSIEIRNNCAIMYKAVRSNLTSIHDSNFKYEVGKTAKVSYINRCEDVACGIGLHVGTIDYATDFGLMKMDTSIKFLECAVPIDKIVFPIPCDNKVRTSELTVLRVMPLEELPIYMQYYKTRTKNAFKWKY